MVLPDVGVRPKLLSPKAQLCEGVFGLAREVESFQAYCGTLVERISELENQALQLAKEPQEQVLVAGKPRSAQGSCAPVASEASLGNVQITFTDTPQPSPRTCEAAGDNGPCEESDNECTIVSAKLRGAEEKDSSEEDEEVGGSHAGEDSEEAVSNRGSGARRVSFESPVISKRMTTRVLAAISSKIEPTVMHLNDSWTELFFVNEKEAEEQLEKIFLKVRQSMRDYNSEVSRGSQTDSSSRRMRVLHPSSQVRVTWDVLGIVLLLWDIVSIPIQVALNLRSSRGSWSSFIFQVTLFYWSCDILLNFFTAFYSKDGKLTTSLKLIAMRYAGRWLFIDLAIVALDWIIYILGDNENVQKFVALRVIRMVRLIRMAKEVKIGRKLEDWCVSHGLKGIAMILSFFKIALELLTMLHFFGCMMYFTGRLTQEGGMKNWLTTYFDPSDDWQYRYLKSVHFMLCQFSPAPFPWTAQNLYEQIVLSTTVLAGLPIIGSNLGRLVALVTQMNAAATADKRIQRELEQYIMIHKFPSELSSKVLRFVEHKLKHSSKSVARPAALSLLPPDLNVEMSLAQVGLALTVHPFISLIMDAKLSIVSELCSAFYSQSFGPFSEVFIADTVSAAMNITSSGTFELQCAKVKKETFEIQCSEGQDGSQSQTSAPMAPRGSSCSRSSTCSRASRRSSRTNQDTMCFEDQQWFAELSLFVDFTHTSTLVTTTFGSTYNISTAEFTATMKGSPISVVAAYEYAKALLASINKDGSDLISKDHLPGSMCTAACTSTQLSEAVFPGKEGADRLDLSTIPQRTPGDVVPMLEFVSGLLTRDTVTDEMLQEMLPELDVNFGTYHAFEHNDERKNCVLSIFSAIWLAKGNYEAITSVQKDPDKRLKLETWEKLQEFMQWVDLSDTMLHGTLVFLSIRGLGKSKRFNSVCPPPARSCPEYGVAYAMTEMTNLMPSAQLLPRHTFALVQSALLLNKKFNFAQFIQGENIPFSVALLEEAVSEQGENLLKFYLFVMLCMMSGLTGRVSLEGSLFLTELNAANLLNGLQFLMTVGIQEPTDIYWGYMRKRAQNIDNFKRRTPEDLAFARLISMTRTMDLKGLGALKEVWEKLHRYDRQSLVKWFVADGISSQALICMFLPNFFSNAVANTMVGLHFALLNLLDLLDRVEEYMDKAQCKVYTIDLSDFAAVLTEVAAPRSLPEMIKQIKILRQDTRISLVLTTDCRAAVSKTAWKRNLGKSRGELAVDSTDAENDGAV